MLVSDKEYTFDRVVRMVLTVVFTIGFIWLLSYLSGALVPFVAALLLAYLFDPLTSLVERWVKSRPVAVILVLLGLLAICITVFLIVVPLMLSEFAHMGRVLSALVSNAELGARAKAYLPEDVWAFLREQAKDPEIRSFFTSEGAIKVTKAVFSKALPGISGVAKGTASFIGAVTGLLIILLYMVFLLMDFGRIKARWQNYLPVQYRETVPEFLDEFEGTMRRYFRGQVTVALLVGVLLSVGFLLIKLPMAIVLGMFTGILNIAPYLGALGLVPATLFATVGAIEVGGSPLMAIGLVLVVFAVVQVIQDMVLVPKIQGQSLGLSPWLILLSLSVWGQLLGFLGLLIALPMTCLCLSYYRRLLARDEREQQQSS